MATRSFLKDVTIRNKKDCKALLNAMENAHKKPSQEVKFSKGYSVATREDIRKMFPDKWQGIKLLT